MIGSFNTHLQPLFEWLLRTTLQASLLICLILLIQAVLGKRLAARWRYCLWLVLFVRMALPWAPQSHISIFNLLPQSLPFAEEVSVLREPGDARPTEAVMASEANKSKAGETDSAGRASDSIRAADVQAAPTLQMPQKGAASAFRRVAALLPWLWLAGVLVLTAYILLSNLLLWRVIQSERPLTNQTILDLLEDCKDQIGTRVILAVIATDKVNTPALFGFVRPRLLLPRAMIEELTLRELRYIFLHELAHLKRHDIVVGYIASFLHVLHWFNPVVWLGFRRVRADRELATDALALSSLKAEETPRYGHAIIRQLERFLQARRLPSLAGLSESKAQIKTRMTMIAKFQNHSYRWSALGIGVTAVLGIVSVTDPTRGTTSASQPAQAKPSVAMRMVDKYSSGYSNVSPDGRYLCDVRKGGITIREFATGEQRTVKPTKSAPDENGPVYPLISPDGKAVAYGVGRKDANETYLCLIGTDGSGQRDICPGVCPVQWFPDGSQILGFLWPPKDNARDIVSVSVSDGSVHQIKRSGVGSFAAGIRLSPDARHVAYDLPSEGGSAKRDIFAVEIDSKQESPLVRHPADDKLLGWTPDGRYILFASDRMGAWDAWLLPVDKGEARGTPELVARNIGDVTPKGFAGNGSYYYEVAYNGGNVYTAEINLAAGQLLSKPAPLEAAGTNRAADWSPDGKRLAYCSYPEPSRQPLVIRIRSLATGEERELFHKLPMVRCLRWSPDGRSLLVSWLTVFEAGKERLPRRVCRVDVDTGDSAVLLEAEKSGVWRAELSPDEKTLYYSGGYALVRRQLDTGEEKQVFEFPQKAQGKWISWALSPNGEYMVAGFNEPTEKEKELVPKIVIIPSRGGQATDLLR